MECSIVAKLNKQEALRCPNILLCEKKKVPASCSRNDSIHMNFLWIHVMTDWNYTTFNTGVAHCKAERMVLLTKIEEPELYLEYVTGDSEAIVINYYIG